MLRATALCCVISACGRFGFGDLPPAVDSACGAPVTSGLVAWWKLDEGIGATTVDAISNNPAMLVGGTTWAPGRLGTGVVLDGITGHIEIGGTSVYATRAAQFSFAAWVEVTAYTPGNVPDLMQLRSDTPSPFHVLMSTDPRWQGVSLGSGDGMWATLKTGVPPPSLAMWHHVAMSYDGVAALQSASFLIYVDGVSQPVVASSGYATQLEASRIGAAEDSRNQLAGIIDEVRVYDRVLGGDEIAQLAAGCD